MKIYCSWVTGTGKPLYLWRRDRKIFSTCTIRTPNIGGGENKITGKTTAPYIQILPKMEAELEQKNVLLNTHMHTPVSHELSSN